MAPSFSKPLALVGLLSTTGVSALNTRASSGVKLLSKSKSKRSAAASFTEDAISGESGAVQRSVFGPEDCVSVWRDQKSGTCQLQTDCKTGTDLEAVEFSFVCSNPGARQKHSFGKGKGRLRWILSRYEKLIKSGVYRPQLPFSFSSGGFDLKETYDTEVACSECSVKKQATAFLGKNAKSGGGDEVRLSHRHMISSNHSRLKSTVNSIVNLISSAEGSH